MAKEIAEAKTSTAIKFTHQSEKLSLQAHDAKDEDSRGALAVEARFITPQDPVIETENGARLPAVPLKEALELNRLRDQVKGQSSKSNHQRHDPARLKHEETGEASSQAESTQSTRPDASLRNAIPPSRTNPLFPELPLYGPPSVLRDIQCIGFRVSSAILSLAFLGVIVLGSAFTSIPLMFQHIGIRLAFRNPDARRPFYEEERRRQHIRDEEAREWKIKRRRKRSSNAEDGNEEEEAGQRDEEFEPTEGGPDPLVCDLGYYARRVGLDAESYEVMTEDGFIIQLDHVYNPKEYRPASPSQRAHGAPVVFPKAFDHDRSNDSRATSSSSTNSSRTCKYPILLIHGLLQSSGAYCANDDSSLAFYLCKSGYDVWLGNNRCGFNPQHQLLKTTDPRMWNWNIRQMGVMDLPALVSRVLFETGFSKLGLICHSQGTTATFVALAKEQRPDLGEKLSVFCALAPAVYAGPLIGKMYLKFMRIISPGMFRIMFGIHSFIPFMMTMHSFLPGRLYGALGYRVFSFLFNWTDDRWDQGLRNRMFQFAPVYVSAESMRWWLGRECFASQKCILATREEGEIEDEEDEEEDDYYAHSTEHSTERMLDGQSHPDQPHPDRGRKAWFDERVPPFALWVAGSDELVEGRRLLRRFERGREPHVRVVHSKIIEEYEHLDVLWAIDSVEKVANEVREVLWKTVPENLRVRCRVPKQCEGVGVWEDPGRKGP
ncbi:hypothetical protein HO173_010396 [Letharia columbiana]|uniref:Partial AB-hydrolase lipase domain-containing protein n=1 Tax=Letharia columbiana TaxID=112416 RepID=A0A8H6L0X0_9LECA|nr:uncharacterized protein HO173_010396 [Letharia columbiana]KAF6231435.1 hypothetical protein HO173_010396 [Letharia columbiana]